MRTQLIILAAAILVSIALTAGIVWKVYDIKMDLLKTSHSLVLKSVEADSMKMKLELIELQAEFENRLSERKKELETDYKRNIQGIRNSIALLDGIRLRDPNSSGNGSAPGDSSPTGSCNGDTGELSEKTSRFLLDLAADADETREKLILCNQFIDEVRKENRELIDRVKEKNKENKSE